MTQSRLNSADVADLKAGDLVLAEFDTNLQRQDLGLDDLPNGQRWTAVGILTPYTSILREDETGLEMGGEGRGQCVVQAGFPSFPGGNLVSIRKIEGVPVADPYRLTLVDRVNSAKASVKKAKDLRDQVNAVVVEAEAATAKAMRALDSYDEKRPV